jgi:hypothetical protein
MNLNEVANFRAIYDPTFFYRQSVMAQNPVYFVIEVNFAVQGRSVACMSGCIYFREL